MRSVTILRAAALVVACSAALGAETSALQPFEFLIGEWPATGSGQPGSAAGTAVFSHALQDSVILRTSFAEYPPQEGKPGSRHDDLMVIHAGPGGVQADYYDSEGHVIRYSVTSPAPGQAVFVSDPAEGQPRFRLSYKAAPDGMTMDGHFEIAPPGSPEVFKPYLSWTSRRVPKTTK